MRALDLLVEDVQYHRNGITGQGFHVVLFQYEDDDGAMRPMVATIFGIYGDSDLPDLNGFVAVLDRFDTATGHVGHENRFRGDLFEPAVRDAVTEWEAAGRPEMRVLA